MKLKFDKYEVEIKNTNQKEVMLGFEAPLTESHKINPHVDQDGKRVFTTIIFDVDLKNETKRAKDLEAIEEYIKNVKKQPLRVCKFSGVIIE